jgi:hypothetical protein
MTVCAFTFVDLYGRALATAAHLLDKGAAHARAAGVSEAAMLDWRLIDDMQPLAFQLMVVVNFSKAWPARFAGLEVPAEIGADLDVAGFQAAIKDAQAWLAARTPGEFEGRDAVLLQVELGTGIKPTLPAERWLGVFSTTNLFFHLSTAYAILRAHGVQIGKVDLFASGL